MEKTLTAEDFRDLGFTDNGFWKDITDEVHLIANPDANSVVRVRESGFDNCKWYVEVETFGKNHRWNCTGHINTLPELIRMYDYCELSPYKK